MTSTATERPSRHADKPTREPVPEPRVARETFVLGGLIAALVVLCVLGGAIGAYNIPISEVMAFVAHKLGLDWGSPPDALGTAVLWEVRFPRVTLTLLVGASLGCAGALMQGSFSNPLADPAIIGVSSGAALGAVGVIAMGVAALGNWTLTVAAFAGGLVTVVIVYALSRAEGRTEVVTLVLTGIAVNAFTGAVIGLLTYFSDDAELRSITFWTLGSTAQATWPKIAAVAPVAVVALLLAPLFGRRLDLLALGEGPARHLGVNVERMRVFAMLTVAVLTAAAVAVAGVITFVGLVVPHAIRMIAGPSHRFLIVASTIGGGTILVGADLIARTIAAPAEVPLGVVTALLGSPVFFYLLRKTRAQQGGWA